MANYFRLLITSNNGSSQYVTVAELSCFDVIGGVGSDLCSGGTASADSFANTSNIPRFAFDDNLTNKWTSHVTPPTPESPHWIQYQFPTNIDLIKSYSLVGCISGQETFAPRDWLAQISDDGSTWETIQSITNETGWAGGESRNFNIENIFISGNTKVNSNNTQCLLRLYNRTTGELVSETQSDNITGDYIFEYLDPIEYDIVCIGDETVCPQISGPLTPVGG